MHAAELAAGLATQIVHVCTVLLSDDAAEAAFCQQQRKVQEGLRFSCTQTLLEGRLLNLDKTSPAPTIALTLTLLQAV